MSWSIEYTDDAQKDLAKFDERTRNSIMNFINENLAQLADPRLRGKALTGKWSGFWRYRFSDFRIICRIKYEKVTVVVVKIALRDKAYK